MSTGTTKAPNLPLPPAEYDQQYFIKLTNVLRLYFAQLDNPGPSAMSTQRTGGTIVSALNFSEPGITGTGQVVSLPTQTDFSNGLIRVGDIYVDTSASNVVKVKTS
jgi:hypothetical protein